MTSQEKQKGAGGLSQMLVAGNATGGKPSRQGTPTGRLERQGSGSKSNIMAIDESGTSLVDFDLSESKFTMGGFFDKTQAEQDKTIALSK